MGLSGRTLRKIPFLAHALYINVSESYKYFLLLIIYVHTQSVCASLECYLSALEKAVTEQFIERQELSRIQPQNQSRMKSNVEE